MRYIGLPCVLLCLLPHQLLTGNSKHALCEASKKAVTTCIAVDESTSCFIADMKDTRSTNNTNLVHPVCACSRFLWIQCRLVFWRQKLFPQASYALAKSATSSLA